MAGTFQIGGLASGLDTGKIIDQLMAIERRPLTSLQKRQQDLQDRKTAYADLSSKLSAVRIKAANLSISTAGRALLSLSTRLRSCSTAIATVTTTLERNFFLNAKNGFFESNCQFVL